MKKLIADNIFCENTGKFVLALSVMDENYNTYIVYYNRLPFYIGWGGYIEELNIDEWDDIWTIYTLTEEDKTEIYDKTTVDVSEILCNVQDVVQDKVHECNMDIYDIEHYNWETFFAREFKNGI